MYNFLEFKELDTIDSIVTNGGMDSDTAWDVDDTAPIGDNDQAWNFNIDHYVNTTALSDPWTSGS